MRCAAPGCSGPAGDAEIRAGAVLLATGGFQGDAGARPAAASAGTPSACPCARTRAASATASGWGSPPARRRAARLGTFYGHTVASARWTVRARGLPAADPVPLARVRPGEPVRPPVHRRVARRRGHQPGARCASRAHAACCCATSGVRARARGQPAVPARPGRRSLRGRARARAPRSRPRTRCEALDRAGRRLGGERGRPSADARRVGGRPVARPPDDVRWRLAATARRAALPRGRGAAHDHVHARRRARRHRGPRRSTATASRVAGLFVRGRRRAAGSRRPATSAGCARARLRPARRWTPRWCTREAGTEDARG